MKRDSDVAGFEEVTQISLSAYNLYYRCGYNQIKLVIYRRVVLELIQILGH